MIKYTVYVNDDRFEIETKNKMTLEEIATKLECDVEEIIQIDDEEI